MPIVAGSEKKQMFRSKLSLQPLVRVLENMIREDKPGAKKLYGPLIDSLEQFPELLKPFDNVSALQQHNEIIEMLLATIFPPSNFEKGNLFALLYPFKFETIYASQSFNKLFGAGGYKNAMLTDAWLTIAYNIILKNFYSIETSSVTSTIHLFSDPETGLARYYELKIDARYVDVSYNETDAPLPEKNDSIRSMNIDELRQILPLQKFTFKGLAIAEASDVTEREVISELKTTLLNINSFSDTAVYNTLQLHIQTLLGLNNISVGITPFFKMNNYFLFSDIHVRNSLLFKHKDAVKSKDIICSDCQDLFHTTTHPVFYQQLCDETGKYANFLKYYKEQNFCSLLLCPLKSDNELLGLLEIGSYDPKQLKPEHISKIDSAIPLFNLALGKGKETLEMQVDRKIKESFTAVQSAVEWKFTEAAFNYIQQKQVNENAKIPPIIFEEVFPLYGAIDIRNSSEERSLAIQKDLIEQLRLAKEVVSKTRTEIQFPLLREIEFKIDKFLTHNPERKITEDEIVIHEFLQTEVYPVFDKLQKNMPELKDTIDMYMNALDPNRKMIYDNRKKYEDTIARINDTLEAFMEHEQQGAQRVFPHYFEHYVTDGVEFNIYIGQSLAPQLKFDEIYVRNLKLWQLTVLAKAARLTHSLEKKIPLPLQTTQLILSHPTPISISFRAKERKFDVDGAYNMRYEIIKKRIDKVHLRGQKERLTQPGTIAVVYTQEKEKQEYIEFIEVLQNEGLILPGMEELHLEELQGVSGLSAIRVQVNLGERFHAPRSNGIRSLLKGEISLD